MKKNIFRNTLVWSLLIFGMASFWFFTYNSLNTNIHYIDANYIADFNDDRKVIWTAENVFVWKVISNEWIANKNATIPGTLFKVEVMYNIKWKIKWNIIVKQQAGYDKYNNLYITGWNEYLEEWKIYLLSTSGNLFTIMSHANWSHIISSDIAKSKSDIKRLIKDNKKVKDWRKAYKNEVFYEDDYKISTEKNAYKKLSKEDKEKFENIENGFLY